MFKFIFRTITLIIFTFFLIIGIALWKGGDPFRTAGEGMQEAGKSISRFGDFVDDIKRGGKKVSKKYDQLKETLSETDITPTEKN